MWGQEGSRGSELPTGGTTQLLLRLKCGPKFVGISLDDFKTASSLVYRATCLSLLRERPTGTIRLVLTWTSTWNKESADSKTATFYVLQAASTGPKVGSTTYLVGSRGCELGRHEEDLRVCLRWAQSGQLEVSLEGCCGEDELQVNVVQSGIDRQRRQVRGTRCHRLLLTSISRHQDQLQEAPLQPLDNNQLHFLLGLVCLGHLHSISTATVACRRCRALQVGPTSNSSSSSASSSSAPSASSSSSSSSLAPSPSPTTSSSSSSSSSSSNFNSSDSQKSDVCCQCRHLCSSSTSRSSQLKSPPIYSGSKSHFHCPSCSSSSSSSSSRSARASWRLESGRHRRYHRQASSAESCSSQSRGKVCRSRRRRRRLAGKGKWLVQRQNVQTQTSVDWCGIGSAGVRHQQAPAVTPPARPSHALEPVPVRVQVSTSKAFGCSGDERHLAAGPSRNLLDPMDLVWRGLGAESRALSCTEASLSNETSSIVAQLKASARSRSLCSGAEAAAAVANGSGGRPSTPSQLLLPKRLLSRVGKLTRSAIEQIRRLSTSTPSIGRRRTLDDDTNDEQQQQQLVMMIKKMKRRSSSQKGMNRRRHSQVLVMPHQLNRFTSASATTLTGGQNLSSVSSKQPLCNNDGKELFYSPDGVYLGPGGVCSWRDACARSASANVATAASQRRRPAPGGAGGSWLARSSVAQALRLGVVAAAAASDPAIGNSMTDRRTPLDELSPGADQTNQKHCIVVPVRANAVEQPSGGFHREEEEFSTVKITEALGEDLATELKFEENEANLNLATFATSDTVGSSMRPTTAVAAAATSQQQQQASNSSKTSPSWLSSLTQRVHGGSGSPHTSQRRRQRAVERRQRIPMLSGIGGGGGKNGTSPPPPYLSKEARSNSLSEGLQRNCQGATSGRLEELSRSSMELAGGFTTAHSHLSQTIAEQTSLYLAELSSRFAGSSHELQLTSFSGRCNPSSSRRNSSDGVGGAGTGPGVYGANLQTICVHCQLIAELANHPQSSYLSQLLPQPPTLSAAELLLVELDQEQEEENTAPLLNRSESLVKPSVVLTFCSNQTTIDQEDEELEEVEEDGDSEFNVEEEELSDSDLVTRASESEVESEGDQDDDSDESDDETNKINDEDSEMEVTGSSLLSSSSSSLGSLNSLQEKVKKAKKSKKARRRRRRRRRRKKKAELDRGQKSVGKKESTKTVAGPVQSLEVPSNKQARSASLDAPYLLKVPQLDFSGSGGEEFASTNSASGSPTLTAAKSSRSRSVDISLPAKPGESYLAATSLQLIESNASLGVGHKSTRASQKHHEAAINPVSATNEQFNQKTKFIQGEIKVACANGETRALKLFVNWEDNCINGEHLWIYVGSSSEACYVGESECLKHGPRLCCSACKIMAHTGCISILIDKIKFICKHTFKDLTLNNPRHVKELQQQNVIYHHWVHKRTHCGRCKQCTKTFGNTKLPFSSKEIQAITCSWCKVSYHNKENCYTLSALTEPCSLGVHRESIIPPTWILKLPNGVQHQPQQQATTIEGVNNSYMSDADPSTIDASMTTTMQPTIQALTAINLEQDSSEVSKLQQTFIDRGVQHYNHGSNTTLQTDTSGYMSTEGINSNVQALTINNNVTNQVRANNTEKNYSNLTIEGSGEILVDPSALQVSDLSLLNQTLSQPPVEKQLHPQENTNQYQKHQLRQYYRQIDASQVNDQAKFGNDDNNEQLDNTSMFMDLQLMQQQQHMQSSTRQVEANNNVYRNFRIVPKPIPGIPNAGSKPVLVFVNPRSGGNQGAKMMQKFNWLLNPRQVFDLIQAGGPRAALELYRDVPNLRILTIGGDGTASWILSYLDEIGIPNKIPVAVLPLGTGNDLARALGWGGGYADEPIAKILTQVRDGEVVQLDRWNLNVERNLDVTALNSPNEFLPNTYSTSNTMEFSSPSISSSPSYFGSLSQQTNNNNTSSTISIIEQTNCDISMNAISNNNNNAMSQADEAGSDRLPMDVINNYFSFGVDAHIALEFHTAREAHPERFSSRLRNKMFYGQAGGKDLLKRKWKDLSNFVALYCDGQDMTGRLKELKVHSVLFLNIPSYSGGTRPWPNTATSNFAKPRTDDGLIEVIGLTTYQLPLLQAGGHGTCIAQCRRAKIITSRTIPMQVDGEPCKLLPSVINISFKNRVCMLAKAKSSNKNISMTTNNIQQQKSN